MQMAAFVEQMQIIKAQLRREAVWIMHCKFTAVGIDPREPIIRWQRFRNPLPFEKIGVGQSPQWLTNVSQTNLPGIRPKCPDSDLLTAIMTTEYRKGIGMPSLT